MSRYEKEINKLKIEPKSWLITGVAGFIGSNILEKLLKLNQRVVGLDNLSTGFKHNLDQVKDLVEPEQWKNFNYIKGDICNLNDCLSACDEVDYVLHQAALGSVPRSIIDPVETNRVNIEGFLNMLLASRDSQVKSFTYAASSSTYGDHPALPKVEENIGKPLSPYAVTKYVNELYASVFSKSYNLKSIGLRYFNVFGPRQNPDGAYAAVVPKWTAAMLSDSDVMIYGDGETSRDFCFVKNVVQANILAATAKDTSKDEVYNIAFGDRTSLNDLFLSIKLSLSDNGHNYNNKPIYSDFRKGDVRHSQADISKVKKLLGYLPSHNISSGIAESMVWYINNVE